MTDPIIIRGRQEVFLASAVPGLDSAAHVLKATTLTINQTEDATPGRPYWEDRGPLRVVGITACVRIDDDALSDALVALGVARHELGVVIVVTTSFLKMEDVIAGPILLADLPDETSAGIVIAAQGAERNGPLAAGHHGFDVGIRLVTTASRGKGHRTVWRRGTVLAEVWFPFRSEHGGGLEVQPLTSAARRHLGLPAGTARYVEFIGEPWNETSPDATITVWVDAKALDLMAGGSAVRDEMQRELVSFVWSSVLLRTAAALPDRAATPFSAVEGSFLGEILASIGDAASVSPATLLRELFENPSRVVARSDSAIGLRRALAGALEKGMAEDGAEGGG